MGFLLVIIAVIMIIITGGNQSSNIDKQQLPEPAAVVRAAPTNEPPQQPMSQIMDRDPMPADELAAQHAALELDELEQLAPIGPNPCVGQDGGMIPNCAVIARKTGEYVLTRQNRIINEWVHVWTR